MQTFSHAIGAINIVFVSVDLLVCKCDFVYYCAIEVNYGAALKLTLSKGVAPVDYNV